MTQTPLQGALRPLLSDEERRRNSRWSDLLRLYRSNTLFRTSAEIAVIGFLVLAAKADYSFVYRQLSGLAEQIYSRQLNAVDRQAMKVAGDIGLPGNTALQSLTARGISRQASVGETPETAQMLDGVDALLAQGKIEDAAELVSKHDHSKPVVAYAKGVVAARLPGSHNYKVSLRLLVYAAQNGVSDASTMLGEIYLSALRMSLNNHLPADMSILIDSVGAAHAASARDLAELARLWLEKAAGLGQVRAFRFLGLMKARGLGGPIDLVSAAALWRQAADLGDDISQMEYGSMLAFGHGIPASAEKASKYLRQASASLPEAKLGLATIMFAHAVAGKPGAAREAISLAESFAGKSDNPELLAMANGMLGELYLRVAPSELREMAKAVRHFRAAMYVGSLVSAQILADMYRWETYLPKDRARAFVLYKHAVENGHEPARQSLADIRKEMSAEELNEAERLKLRTLKSDASTASATTGNTLTNLQAKAISADLFLVN